MELRTIYVDPSYQKILEDENLIEFLKLIENACNSNSGGTRSFGPPEWMTGVNAPCLRQTSKNMKRLMPIRDFVHKTLTQL